MASIDNPVGGATAIMPRSGRDTEFADYMRRRQQSLLRTAYLLTGDVHAAEDLVQASLVKLYRAWDRVGTSDSLDGYARRILVNEHHSLWRRPWRRREVSVEDVLIDIADAPDDREGRAALWRLVCSLPPKQRTVTVLRYYEGLSVAEVSDLMGISEGTVKSQASRAVAALRAHPELSDLEDWS